MGICLDAACEGAPYWVVGLAVIGGIVIYALIGWIIYSIIKSFKDDLDADFIILCIIFWPIIIGGAIVYSIVYYGFGYIFKFFAMPIVGADKHDLRVLEDNIVDKMDTKITREDNKIMNYLENDYVPPKPVRKAKTPSKDKAKKKKAKK